MSLLVEISSSPSSSLAYEHGIELAIAAADADPEVTVWLSGEAALAAMALSFCPEDVFIKKLKQLELMEIPCVAYNGLHLGEVLGFVKLLDRQALRDLLTSSSKCVVF